ncbi:flavin-binding monooxygenase-like domain-containing protein [Ditylenchus destructor]|uniref:Flavin-containing monooxygenase n=1 Tax=Ditylenchus destructor TaxID=166010 RepID=A0AAD4NCZ0_9BILA|nr:flavin-binding monooxygenase-like domain-containing protein [Ditylenchus destructor]
MEKNRGVIRELLKFEFELGHSAKEAMDNINRAKGAGTVSRTTAYEWFSKFKSGNMTIEDNPRSGRPREVDRDAVVNAVEDTFTIFISEKLIYPIFYWAILSRNTELFDAILVCTGMHRDPWRPPLYRQEKYFKGRVIHACNYKQPKSDYSSKTVVVVGCGNSAVEIACYLAPIAKQVYLCIRRGNWLLDKTDKDGRPWDVNFNSRFHALGRKIVPKYIRNFLWELDAQKVLINSQEESKPQHRFFSTNFTFSADLPLNIENGRIIIKPNLLSFSENGVEFDDHSTVDQVDEVIFCTGYEFSFPFVEQGELVRTRNNDFHLFNHMYLPDLAPHHTLAVIGHVQPRGSLIPVAEMQCRYFFHALSGHMQLPSPFQMKVQLEERRCDMSLDYLKTRRHTQIEDYVEFMDQLAVAIGAKPNILSILTSDLRLALKSFFGPCVPYQYRLVGPHTWTGARKAIEDASSGSALLKSDYVQIMKYTAIWLFLLWLLSIMW